MAGFEERVINQNAPDILDRLGREFGLLCNVRHNVDNIGEALSRLTASRDDLDDAIKRKPQEKRPEQVASWFKRVKEVEAEVAKIQQDYSHRCLCVGSFSPNIISSYAISGRAVREHQRVHDLLQEYDEVKDLTGVVPPSSCIEKPLPSVVVGKSLHLAKVLACLDDVETGIISICGMPGVGKSELMRCVNNEFLPGSEKEKVFSYVVWVDNASSDVKTVQDDIARRLKLGDLGPLDERKEGDAERRAGPIFSVLNATSFLVLLDNLTSHVPLATIGIPNPIRRRCPHKQKVVLTTPLKGVSGIMSSCCRIDVECLGRDESWELFASFLMNAHGKARKEITEQVVEECGGLPVVLTNVGGMMATKRWPDDWNRTARLLRSSRFHLIPGMEAENTAVLRDLKKIYDYGLSSDSHRACFLCCALWPRGRSINKAELIDCWIGLGLITDPSPGDAVLNGFSIISSLQDAYLLLPDDIDNKDQVKLQPVVRDMALWIACDCGKNNKWMVHDGVNLNAEDKVVELCERAEGAERVSLMCSSIQELRQSALSSSRCPSLVVLMLQHNNKFTNISGAFLRAAPALEYLDLSYTEIHELPQEIGTLLMLQFLNLSFTKIKALPIELGHLKRLKHLLLKDTNHLSIIPAGVFRNLESLQVVDMYPSQYMHWEDDNEGITTVEKMFSSTAFIQSLGITINAFSTAQRLGRLVNVCTSRLLFTHFVSTPTVILCPSRFKELMGSFSLFETLLEVSISKCTTLEQLVFDGEEEDGKTNESWCLQKLENLELRGLDKLKDIMWKRMSTTFFLKAVSCVKIQDCNSLKNVSWVRLLSRLQHLELRNCAAMSSVIDVHESQDGNEKPPAFSHLMTFVLVNLPKLRNICIPQVSFPSLEVVEVQRCIDLRRIPIKLQKNLREIRGSKDWWEHLNWDGDNNAQSLCPYFVDTRAGNSSHT